MQADLSRQTVGPQYMPRAPVPPETTRPVATSRIAWSRTRQLVVVMVLAGAALGVLTIIASQAGPDAVDLQATLWLQRITFPPFASLMYWVSWMGFRPQNLALPVVVAGCFALAGYRVEAIWVLGTAASAVVTVLLKDLVHRPRPDPDLVGVSAALPDWSFPSGHTVQYTTLFCFAFFLVFVLGRRSTARTVCLIVLALPVVLVGPSRLYLGQHWLSDVLGGYAVAVLLLVPYCWAYARVRLPAIRRARLPETRQDEPKPTTARAR
jgi:membrane-associated phospholipid phosphatase